MKTTTLTLMAFVTRFSLISANPLRSRGTNPATNPLCNQIGWDAGTESYASSSAGGYQGCSSACYADSQCKSFAYTDNDCQLYTTAIKDNFADDSESPYTFYDAGCEKASDTCGTKGYYVNKYPYVTSDTTNYPERQNAQWCYQYCLGEGRNCLSFAMDGGHCALYHVPVIGNLMPLPQNVGGGRAFYDVSCPTFKSSVSSTTSTTKATTTKSSTTKVATTTGTNKSTTTTTTTARTSSTISVTTSATPATTSSATPKATTTTATASTTRAMVCSYV